MTYRTTVAVLYTEDNMPEDRGGYNDNVVAFCTLNGILEGFVVYEHKSWFKPPVYVLRTRLWSARNHREMGSATFTDKQEAIDFGVGVIKFLFPELLAEPGEGDIKYEAWPVRKDAKDE